MNNMVAGIGDVLLRYPELIESLSASEADQLDCMTPYVAVHLGASAPEKIPPHHERLIGRLHNAGIHFLIVGNHPPLESGFLIPKLRLHIEAVKRARKFIGTLSCFNVVAQLTKVPSFVLVNASIKEPFVYGLMHQNRARVEPWNVGKSIEQIYTEAVEWARS